MPNFEAAPQQGAEEQKDFLDAEEERLDSEQTAAERIGDMISEELGDDKDMEAERGKELAMAVESVVDAEAGNYVGSVMEALRASGVSPSAEQLVKGLTKDAVERLKASDASFADITENSKGVQALARRGLKKAMEAEMSNLGGDDLEILSKVEKVLGDL